MAIEIVDLPIENGGSFHSYFDPGWKSVGMMTFPTEWKQHVPNHQPVQYSTI